MTVELRLRTGCGGATRPIAALLASATIAITLAGCGSAEPRSAAAPTRAAGGMDGRPPPASGGPLRVTAGSFQFQITNVEVLRKLDDRTLAQIVARWLEQRAGSHRSGLLIASIRWPAVAATALRRAIRERLTGVTLAVVITRARLQLRPVRQAYRNNCETAALAMALDQRIVQRRLQAALPHARPVERQTTSQGVIWGDPQRGFVGGLNRAGYGVYESPLLRVARRLEQPVSNLSGRSLSAIVRSVTSGRAVVAWVSLGPSRPITWRTPDGRTIRADAAEHAVTVVGFTRASIVYNDPIDGRRRSVTRAVFERRWRDLGRRAIVGPPLTAPTATLAMAK